MAIPFLSNIDLNKNQLLNHTLHNATTDPSAPNEGQIYYNTSSDKVLVYNGSAWISIAGDITAVTSATTNQLTVANENGPAPAFSIVTGAVTNGSTALATGDQIYDFVIEQNYSTTTGTVTSVTSGNADTITIGGTAADPSVAANTAAVTNGSTNLATGDQIYDFTYGNFLPLVAGSTNPLSGDLYITHNNADIILGNPNAANTANRIEGLGASGKTFIQFGFNQNDAGDEHQRIKIGYNGGAGDYIFLSANVEEEDLPANGIKSGSIGIGSGITNFVMDTISLNAGTVTASRDLNVTRNLSVVGNLTVTGTTTTNNVETVSTSNGVIFEGNAADDNELILLAGTLTGDQTITLPDATGTVALTSDITGTNSGTNTGDQLVFKNVASDSGTAVADTTADTLTIAGGNNVTTSVTNDTLTINATDNNTQLATAAALIDISAMAANSTASFTHGLTSQNLIVQMYDTNDGQVVHADIDHTSTSAISILFSRTGTQMVADGIGDIRVVVIDAKNGLTDKTVSYS